MGWRNCAELAKELDLDAEKFAKTFAGYKIRNCFQEEGVLAGWWEEKNRFMDEKGIIRGCEGGPGMSLPQPGVHVTVPKPPRWFSSSGLSSYDIDLPEVMQVLPRVALAHRELLDALAKVRSTEAEEKKARDAMLEAEKVAKSFHNEAEKARCGYESALRRYGEALKKSEE